MPLVIGVTGSIACGKSTVCKTLEELGAVHCDADPLVHRMYDPGKPGYDRIIEAFGQDVVGADGYIDRKVLGARVFGKPDEMGKLTRAIGDIGGEVHRVVDEWRATLPEDAVAVLEAVNMIEPGYSAWLDQTWLVATERENAIRRIIDRNQFSIEEATQRVDGQRPWQSRAPAADHVFHNDGTLQDLIDAVKREFERVRDLHRRGELPPRKYDAWRAEMQSQMAARSESRRQQQ